MADEFRESTTDGQNNRETSRSLIEGFIETIPNQNRAEAIATASKKREEFISRVWERERNKLQETIVTENNLTADTEGWNRYLQFVYNQESSRQKERFGFEEWSVKYISEMLSSLEQDVTYSTHIERQGLPQRDDLLKVPESYFECHSKDGIFNYEVAQGIYKPIESDSLLVHSLSKGSLEAVIRSGVVGAGGLAACAMSQDRIIYDNGYVVIFQAKDLVDAGYPLLQINEDPRDAKILKEWRTPMPIDINLARLIVPTSNIPDRGRVANQAQIAHTFFGEEYLRQIPRI